MDEHLNNLLRKDNPWLMGGELGPWFARHLPRRYIPRRARLKADEKVSLVIGPRQAGKSTLIWHTLASTDEPVLYLNCEEPSIRELADSAASFLVRLEGILQQPVAMLFEEVQHLGEAGLFLKGLVDRRPGVPLYATGSSSFHLEAGTRESLAGRAHRHLLLPLSLDEAGAAQPAASPLAAGLQRTELLRRLLVHGGYPRVVQSTSPTHELAELVEAFIIRDASDRLNIRFPAAFRQLLQMAASQIGNLINASEWGAAAGVSNDTARQYLDLMEQCHVLRLVRPFVGGKRAEITSRPKVFFIDNGIRNTLFGGLGTADGRADRGALLENYVFTEIYKHINVLLDTVHYWRTTGNTEVNFVLNHQGRLLVVEVKWGDARGQVPRALRSFIKAYQPQSALVIHGGEPRNAVIDGTPVRFVAPTDVAREVLAFRGEPV